MKDALKVIGGVIILILAIALFTNSSPNVQNNSNIQTEDFSLISDKLIKNDDGSCCIEGTIKNNTDKTYDFVQAVFSIYDDSNNQIGQAIAGIRNFEAYETWKFCAINLLDLQFSSYKFVEVEVYEN